MSASLANSFVGDAGLLSDEQIDSAFPAFSNWFNSHKKEIQEVYSANEILQREFTLKEFGLEMWQEI